MIGGLYHDNHGIHKALRELQKKYLFMVLLKEKGHTEFFKCIMDAVALRLA